MNHSIAIPTLSLSVTLIPKHPIRHLHAPILRRNFTNPKLFFPLRLNETPTSLAAKRVSQVRATVDGDGKTGNWVNRLPIPGLGAENVFRLISSATGSPIGQFISSHVTFLRSVDPRIKLVSCDRCLNQASHWLCVRASYIPKLKENLAALDTNMEELKAKRDDVSRRVKREEDRGLQRLAEIQVWLLRVEAMENEVNDFLKARNVELERLCLCGFCSKSLKSSYCYGKRVFSILQKVEDLKSSGAFELVADQHTQASSVEERPIGHTIVGQKSTLQDAWKYLMEDGVVGIIGVYGMGGVGKTTLLMQINNKIFDEGCLFDDVIWSVVSKDLQIQKIQDDIAKKLDIYCEEWNKNDESQKACKIYNILKKKKFVLLLDDIWEKVELSKIGVPSPSRENGCKVVLTTRSQGVCGRMGANADMEVRCLEAHDALDLFKKKIGKVTLESHSGIPELAKKVAKKCHGLPLALNVIGETMARKRTIQEWQRAIDVLNPYAAEFSGMKDEILPVLKYSYDSLMDEQLKSCLLYCALFPEDDRIRKADLIHYWICEGIIDGNEGVQRAENQGYEIIGTLVRSSLLMVDRSYQVYMHDSVREMAIWIASDFGKQRDNFIARVGVGLYELPMVEKWCVVRRMSLMSNKIDHLSGSPKCQELTTLFLQKNETLSKISVGFFRFMPKLVVLDLSWCTNFSELPDDISELLSLKYLNMSGTGIKRLPIGLQELKMLTHLNMESTSDLLSIVGISSLLNLKVLRLNYSGVSSKLSTVEELQVLAGLELLTIEISSGSGLDKFLSSHRLTSCTSNLHISGLELESSGISLPSNMDKLRDLYLRDCSISEIKMNKIGIRIDMVNSCFLSLRTVRIHDCKCLRELTWLVFAPNLAYLAISTLNQLEDVISKEKACIGEDLRMVPFRKLECLDLFRLLELKNIYWSPLRFPCLKLIIVEDCPKLRKLPLDSKSGPEGEKGLIIKYLGNEWIEGVEWEDEATKDRFLPSCLRI